MIITPANNAFFVTSVLEPRFWAAFGVTEAWWSKVATPYNVEGEQMIIPWMGMIDKYREWVGTRRTRQPAPQTYLVPIKNFELTEELDEFRLADSTAATATSYYAPTLAFMGLQAKKIYDYNLRDMIENAAGGAWGARASVATAHPGRPAACAAPAHPLQSRPRRPVRGLGAGLLSGSLEPRSALRPHHPQESDGRYGGGGAGPGGTIAPRTPGRPGG